MPSGIYKRTSKKVIKTCVSCKTVYLSEPSRNLKYCGNSCRLAENGKQNIKIKTDSKSYRGLHSWVERKLGNPKICENCGATDKKRYHWANMSGEYRIDLTDWARLCVRCHCWIDDWIAKGRSNKSAT